MGALHKILLLFYQYGLTTQHSDPCLSRPVKFSSPQLLLKCQDLFFLSVLAKTTDRMPASAEIFSRSVFWLPLIQLQLKVEKVPADLTASNGLQSVCANVCLIGRNRMLSIPVLGSFWFGHIAIHFLLRYQEHKLHIFSD